MVKLVEVVRDLTDRYTLREVYLNPKHVVCLREDVHAKRALMEGQFPKDLDSRQNFTKVFMENGTFGTEMIIVGTPSEIRAKLTPAQKELLRG
tara:strand:- start:242 stop:520 length:279 start_codon:yes stop_codon:yes gene_type:complete